MSDLGGDNSSAVAGAQLLAFVERIESMEAEIAERNGDKRDIYAEAKGNGYDVKAIKAIVRRRAKDPGEAAEEDAVVDTYLTAIQQAEIRRGGGARGT